MAMKRGYKQMLDEANAAVETLSPSEAMGLVGNAGIVFVDVRDVREREKEGEIPQAFHAPRATLEFWIDPESPFHKPVFSEPKRFVFFCSGGWRSALSAKTAQDMGLTQVAHIDGGFNAWKAAGGAVSLATSTP